MSLNTASGDICGLASYIRNDLYKHWEQERSKLLELKWQRNLDAFNCVSSGKWKKQEGEDWRSNTFVGLTKMKVMAAWSMVTDMMLQGGKLPFTVITSPWDDMVLEDLPPEQSQPIRDAIEEQIDIIGQQLCDCHADRQIMKNILSGGIYGETYTKQFVHEVERTGYKQVSFAPQGLEDPNGQHTRFIPYRRTKNAPGFEYASVWDIYRDLETDDIQAGIGIIHRQMTSPYELRKLKGQAYSLDENIKHAIDEAAEPGDQPSQQKTGTLPPGQRNIAHRFNTIEELEFWGRVPRAVVEQFEKEQEVKPGLYSAGEYELDGDEVEIMCLLANDDVASYALTTPGKRPFNRSVWEIKLDHVEATSVADNVEDVQLVLNGMVRAFEDNKKLSANVILALKKRYLGPGALQSGIKPGEQIEIADQCDDVRMAIQQVIIQDVGQTLLDGIGLFERYGDEASQIPKLSQGFTPEKQKPDTAYELSQLLTNAGKYLGGVIKNQDEGLIEPNITHFLEYNMQDPDQKKGKGNFIAKALGFTSFQDRVVKNNSLQRFLMILLSNETLAQEGKFTELLAEIAKGLDIERNQVLKTAQEKAEDAKRQQESPLYQLQLEAAQLDVENKKLENEKIKEEMEKLQAEVEKIMNDLNLEARKIQQGDEKLDLDAEKVTGELDQGDEELKIKRAQVVNDMREKETSAAT